jgi:hypothetical protein
VHAHVPPLQSQFSTAHCWQPPTFVQLVRHPIGGGVLQPCAEQVVVQHGSPSAHPGAQVSAS